jgi:hypothetical protein
MQRQKIEYSTMVSIASKEHRGENEGETGDQW